MRKRFHRKPGKLLRPKPLTTEESILYDVVAINKATGDIYSVGQVTSIEEAKDLKVENGFPGCKYYILENNSVLTEIV